MKKRQENNELFSCRFLGRLHTKALLSAHRTTPISYRLHASLSDSFPEALPAYLFLDPHTLHAAVTAVQLRFAYGFIGTDFHIIFLSWREFFRYCLGNSFLGLHVHRLRFLKFFIVCIRDLVSRSLAVPRPLNGYLLSLAAFYALDGAFLGLYCNCDFFIFCFIVVLAGC